MVNTVLFLQYYSNRITGNAMLGYTVYIGIFKYGNMEYSNIVIIVWYWDIASSVCIFGILGSLQL